MLESLAERRKKFIDPLSGAESRILVENSDHLLTFAKELNKALKEAGENDLNVMALQNTVKVSIINIHGIVSLTPMRCGGEIIQTQRSETHDYI